MKIGITERGDAAVDLNKWIPQLDYVDGAIIITKDPVFLIKHLDKFDTTKCIFHCTITGWGATDLEPYVAPPQLTLTAYDRLVDQFGGDRVVLRIDPIIPLRTGLATAKRIYKWARGRVRISFLDMYPHVRDRLRVVYPKMLIAWDQQHGNGNLHAKLETRRKLLKAFPGAEVCGEPNLPCTGCISQKDLDVLGLTYDGGATSRQRSACSCLSIKTELLDRRQPCKHGCLYCYWK
jgi:hypothetical protein